MSVRAPIAPIAADETAQQTVTRQQARVFAAAGMLFLLGLVTVRLLALQIVVGLAILSYVFIVVYKLGVLYTSVREGTPTYDPVQGDDLPVYSILVPLYHEANVLPGLLRALGDLDYPPDKLDVLFLLEEDDQETLDACLAIGLEPHVRVAVVPQGYPKTKPRACNHGLALSRGEYVVIYDAEDRPEPAQLRKALAAFATVPAEVVCLQAKLAYYNQRQNVLTRMFTIDYAHWFEAILPGLTRLHAPIPLGGTSNHFRADALRALGGWDPYNVAEDADLGIRLVRRGYRAEIFESVTWEEANSEVRSWIKQRSRWTKGYMQTFLVHTRHPVVLWREIGPLNVWRFVTLVAGTWLAALLNPIFWVLGIAYYTTRSTAIEALFVTPVYYLGLFCLLAGNFIFVYMHVYTAVKWGYDGLAKWALLTPFYWILHSIAAYLALYELITKPHHWQKTTHGLAPQAASPATSGAVAAGAAGLPAP